MGLKISKRTIKNYGFLSRSYIPLLCKINLFMIFKFAPCLGIHKNVDIKISAHGAFME